VRKAFIAILLCVVASLARAQTTSNPLAVNISAASSDCSVANSCAWQLVTMSAGQSVVTLAGTFSGTFIVEQTNNGTAWTTAATLTSAGTTTYNQNGFTAIRVRCSAYTSGTAAVTVSTGTGGSSSGGGGGANTTSQTFGGSPSNAYTFSVVSGTTYATNNKTGAIDYQNSDAAVVINNALAAIATTGGTLYFKNGVYNFNSATQESNGGCTQFYSVGIPNNPVATWVQFHFEGESRTPWMGELLPASINTQGVIFNVTSSAITAAGSSMLFAVWQRPNNIGSGCSLIGSVAPSPFSNELYFKNITVRFPANTRGNEGAIVPWAASTIDYENVLADFNQTYTAIATGSAPVATSFGLASTYSGSGNLQHFKDTYVVGYGLCYDLESEHVVGDTMTAIYCNNSAEIGRQGTAIFHPIVLTKFTDQECGAGFIFGPQMVQGSRVDMIGLDFEFGTDANWYSTARGKIAKFSETNAGYSSGIITYEVTQQNVGAAAELPSSTLFTSGGQNFQAFEGTTAPNIAQTPVSDSFTRADNAGSGAGANGIGPQWATGTQASNHNLKIASNAYQINFASAGTGYSNYLAQAFNSDQFSKATVASIDSASTTFFEVMTNMTLTAGVQTYNTYYCSHVAAGGSGIIKVVAGASTTLASQTSSVGCNASDTLELRSIGGFLWAYRNGALDTNFSPNPVATTVSGGAPGINLVQDTAAGVSGSTWNGGSFPTMHGTDSIYGNDTIHSRYSTLSNCSSSASPAVCGSAAAGSVAVPTGSTPTLQINTTAVTANSQIFVTIDEGLGTKLAVTCNNTLSTLVDPVVTARTAGTSFTIQINATLAVNPACVSYFIVN
jgi:hypothetical protein